METRRLKYLSIFLQWNRLLVKQALSLWQLAYGVREGPLTFIPACKWHKMIKKNCILATRSWMVTGFDCYGLGQGDVNFPWISCDERAFILRLNLVTDVRACTQSKSLGLFVRWNKNVISLEKQINQWTPHSPSTRDSADARHTVAA